MDTRIIDNIANIFKNDNPVANDIIITFVTSKLYLHIFSLLYFIDSS